MRKKNLLFFLLLTVLFTACKTKQQIAKPLTERSPVDELIDKMQKAEPQFTTANVSKMNMTMNLQGRTFNVSATCKIRKDSVMHISIQPAFGFELFKVEITPDSIRAFDKLNKRMYATDFSFFEKRFGLSVDYYGLQAIISNRFFTIGDKEPQIDQCKLSPIGNEFNQVVYESNQMSQSTQVDALYRIEKVELKSKNTNYTMSANYSGFMTLDSLVFPQKINIMATDKKNTLNCDFTISKAVFNNKIVFSSLDPGRYDRADINQLMKK
ncbi:MAG: DUF4292 domain-containing protein [Paludibacter sp.]